MVAERMTLGFDRGGPAVTEAALMRSLLDVAAADSLPALSSTCFSALHEWMGSDTLGLYLFSDGESSEEVRFAENVPAGFLEDYDANVRPFDAILRHVVRAREAISGLDLHGPNLWARSRSYAHLRRYGFDQTVLGPILIDDKFVGTIYVAATERDGPFEPRDMARFAAICRAASIALGRIPDWTPPVSRRLVHRPPTSARTVLSSAASPAPPRPLTDGAMRLAAALPPRARQVANLLCRGTSNKEIARRLNLSPYTVRDHVQFLCRRFGVANRTELAARLLGDESHSSD